MKVFISWSGNVSKKVAIELKDWLPNVLQYTKPFVSAEDIDAGARWSQNIAKELEEALYGIIIVTKDNINAPWINFEAGALSKQFENSFVSPFLIDLTPTQISGPIVQFQSIESDEIGIKRLVNSINKTAPEEVKLDNSRLNHALDVWLPFIIEKIKEIKNQYPTEKVDQKAAQTNESINTTENQIAEILQLLRLQEKNMINNKRDKNKGLPRDYDNDLIITYSRSVITDLDRVIELLAEFGSLSDADKYTLLKDLESIRETHMKMISMQKKRRNINVHGI